MGKTVLSNFFIVLSEHKLQIWSLKEVSRVVPSVQSSVTEDCERPETLPQTVTDGVNEGMFWVGFEELFEPVYFDRCHDFE